MNGCRRWVVELGLVVGSLGRAWRQPPSSNSNTWHQEPSRFEPRDWQFGWQHLFRLVGNQSARWICTLRGSLKSARILLFIWLFRINGNPLPNTLFHLSRMAYGSRVGPRATVNSVGKVLSLHYAVFWFHVFRLGSAIVVKGVSPLSCIQGVKTSFHLILSHPPEWESNRRFTCLLPFII